MSQTPTRTATQAALAAAIAIGAGGGALAGDIELTGGAADLTWFYNSEQDAWDVVMRTKGNTEATGLDSPFAGPAGGVGGSDNDYDFNTLTVYAATPTPRSLNGIDFYTIGPSAEHGRPDLGIRTRLRELDADEQTIDQFDGFQLTVDWENSQKPDGAEFAMWNLDSFGAPDQTLYDTSEGDFQREWAQWGHTHWVWGFSEPGEYELAFDFEGVGGQYGDSANPGNTSVNFTIVPEPGSLALLGVGGAVLLMRRRGRN